MDHKKDPKVSRSDLSFLKLEKIPPIRGNSKSPAESVFLFGVQIKIKVPRVNIVASIYLFEKLKKLHRLYLQFLQRILINFSFISRHDSFELYNFFIVFPNEHWRIHNINFLFQKFWRKVCGLYPKAIKSIQYFHANFFIICLSNWL